MVMLKRSFSLGMSVTYPGLDTTPDELEFALAMYAYQKKHRRRYPAWSEVLFVLKSLGYAKGVPPDEPFSRTTPAEIEACS